MAPMIRPADNSDRGGACPTCMPRVRVPPLSFVHRNMNTARPNRTSPERRMLAPWFMLTADAARLAFDAGKVIELRLAQLAKCGPDVPFEAHRMVAEKQAAFFEAA